MGEFIPVAKAGEIAAGQVKVVSAKGRTIAVFNVDGELCAIDNACRHKGGPLGEGFLEGACITCPLHGWQYDVKTGECFTTPGMNVAKYNVKTEGGNVLVEV